MELELNTIILLVVAVLSIVNTLYSRKVEKNTNSMKDELVKRTVEATEAKTIADMKKRMEDGS